MQPPAPRRDRRSSRGAEPPSSAARRWLPLACVLSALAVGCGGGDPADDGFGSPGEGFKAGAAGKAGGGGQGGSGQGGNAQAGSAQGGSAQGGSAQGGSGGAEQGGSAGSISLGGGGTGGDNDCFDASDCDDLNACTRDTCKPGAGEFGGTCLHTPMASGAPCSTAGEQGVCEGLVCLAPCGAGCDDGNPCTVDTCGPGGNCVFQPSVDGAPCDDGDECTEGDACKGGLCGGTPDTSCEPPPLVDEGCKPGCGAGDKVFTPPVPLTAPPFLGPCTKGFSINNPTPGVYTLESTLPIGSPGRLLDIQLATYKVPDHIRVTATDPKGVEYVLVDTCTLQTSSYAFAQCARPPDDSIRQHKAEITPGTRRITFDFTGVCSPVYLQVLGLCDFETKTFPSKCGGSTGG